MDKQLLQIYENFEAEMMNFLLIATTEMKNNSTLASCELILAFAADAYRGALGSAKNTSLTGVSRSARSLFEIHIDSELIKTDNLPAEKLVDFKMYSLVETRKLKNILGQTPTPDEEEASKKFLDKNGKLHKHWSKIDTIANRAKTLGSDFIYTYNSFYRISSLATHGSASFGIFYQDSAVLHKAIGDNMSLAMNFTFKIFENCVGLSSPQDTQLRSSYTSLENFKKSIIAD